MGSQEGEIPEKNTYNNSAVHERLFECTTHSTLNWMGYSNRRAQRVSKYKSIDEFCLVSVDHADGVRKYKLSIA